jgi:hypothetical protein
MPPPAGRNAGENRLPMTDAIEDLLSISSPALGTTTPDAGRVPAALGRLLAQRNGFYAFEGALHVFADREAPGELGLERWNAQDVWRDRYGGLADNHFFFAEDVFGGQFSISDGGIVTWDPETGQTEPLAGDVEGWAQALLDDFQVLTGQPVAHEWQAAHGPLSLGERLLPITPFVLGGDFSISNLRAVDAVAAMRYRGVLATQLHDLPEGTAVRLKYIE